MKKETVKLIECIVTWQGEGKNNGERMLLTRFKFCNKNCPWCDTKIKMKSTLEAEYRLDDIQTVINSQKLSLMITGGEPTIKNHIDDTIKLLNKLYYPLANVETNGYNLEALMNNIDPEKHVHYMWSPKIFKDTDLTQTKEIFDNIKDNENVFIKIVHEPDNLFLEPLYMYITRNNNINHKIFLMPKGVTRKELLKSAPETFDVAEKYKFNFSSRTHLMFDFV